VLADGVGALMAGVSDGGCRRRRRRPDPRLRGRL